MVRSFVPSDLTSSGSLTQRSVFKVDGYNEKFRTLRSHIWTSNFEPSSNAKLRVFNRYLQRGAVPWPCYPTGRSATISREAFRPTSSQLARIPVRSRYRGTPGARWTADEQLMNSWWTMDLAALLWFFSKSSMIDWLVTSFRTVLCQTIWSFGDWILPAFPWFLVPKHSGGGHQQAVHDLGWLRFGKQGSIFWNVEIGLYQNGGIHQFLAIFKGDNDEKSWVG